MGWLDLGLTKDDNSYVDGTKHTKFMGLLEQTILSLKSCEKAIKKDKRQDLSKITFLQGGRDEFTFKKVTERLRSF